ncbi:MAG: DUF4258 domain-containing protein [Nitrospinota bacterium]
MGESLDLDRVRRAIRARRVDWQRHALERMAERHIARTEAFQVLLAGERIEDYPDTVPFPSALFLGWSGPRPLHVVVAYDSSKDRVFVITVYDPDLEHFEPDFKTRRAP